MTEVVRRDVPVEMELVGQTKGFQDVDIRARVEGFLDAVDFAEGTLVRKGRGALPHRSRSRSRRRSPTRKAELATAQARYEKTQNDVKRLAAARRQAGRQRAGARQRRGLRGSRPRAGGGAQGGRREARRSTSATPTVVSPIDGLVGTTLVKAGSLVGRGESTLLTTVSQIDPILFRAGISEAEYSADRAAGRGSCARRAAARRSRSSSCWPTASVHPQKGYLDAVERAVDATTGTLTLQFKFPNPGGLVRPGQYGRARFVLESKKDAMLVPQRAVQELQNLYSVAVVGADNKVAFKTVTMGPRMGSLWVVESGLQGNERVVVAGLQRLRDGMVVTAEARARRRPRAAASPSRPGGSRGAVGHGPFLRQPAHRGDGLVHRHGDAGPRGDAGAADRAVPRDRPAHGADHDDVRRRERHRRRGCRRDAPRAEDQRRREGHLHEVHQRQRRHVDVEGVLRGRQQPRHGQRPDAEPRVGGDAAAAAVGQELRRGGEEGAGLPAAGHLGQVAERARTTTTSCRTTRPSTSTTTSRASPASGRSTCSAAATTRCACGCGPIGSRSSGSRCPTSSTRSASRTS